MPTTTIPNPQSPKWSQFNNGPAYGLLRKTFGVDLTRVPGSVMLSPVLLKAFDEDDESLMKVPIAAKRSIADGTDRWWILTADTSGSIFYSADSNPVGEIFTRDTAAPSGASLTVMNSDLEGFENIIVVTTTTNIARRSGGSWISNWWTATLAQAGLNSLVPHPLKAGFDGRLLVGDGNLVHVIDRNNNVSHSRLRFPPEYTVTKILSSSNRYWILTFNTRAREAVVYEWDGTAENFNRVFGVEARRCLSGVVKDDVAYVLTDDGILRRFNGGDFVECGRLPIASKKSIHLWQSDGTTNYVVHRNGMSVIDGHVCILLTGIINSSALNRIYEMPGGIWEFDDDNGLYCKYPLGSGKVVAGVYTRLDYGQQTVSGVGVLTGNDDGSGYLLAGASISSPTSLKDSLFYLGGISGNRGFLVTQPIHSSGLRSAWQKLSAMFTGVTGESLDLYYRKKRNENFWQDGVLSEIVSITWVTQTQFTTIDTDFAFVAAGDVVEVMFGRGSGAHLRVRAITFASPTYTVDLEEAIGFDVSGSPTARVYLTEFRFLKTTTDIGNQYTEVRIDEHSQWIELLVVLRGSGLLTLSPQLTQLVLTSGVSQRHES